MESNNGHVGTVVPFFVTHDPEVLAILAGKF